MEIFLVCIGCFGLFVVSAIVFLFALYNRLVGLRNMVDEGWSGIDVQLKRRYDLIPNVVETVKGYAAHEKDTFRKVVELRNSAMSAKGIEEKGKLESSLTESIKSLFALAEAYPDLKANQNFLDLQGQLSKIEDDLQNARRYYNGTVRNYNTTAQQFPAKLVAGSFGFKEKEFFGAAEEEKQNVKVDFSDKNIEKG